MSSCARRGLYAGRSGRSSASERNARCLSAPHLIGTVQTCCLPHDSLSLKHIIPASFFLFFRNGSKQFLSSYLTAPQSGTATGTRITTAQPHNNGCSQVRLPNSNLPFLADENTLLCHEGFDALKLQASSFCLLKSSHAKEGLANDSTLRWTDTTIDDRGELPAVYYFLVVTAAAQRHNHNCCLS